MPISAKPEPDRTVITGVGRLHAGGATQPRRVVSRTVAPGRHGADLAVGGAGSRKFSGPGAPAGTPGPARPAGGDLRAARIRPPRHEAFELTGRDRVTTPCAPGEDGSSDA